MILVGPFQLGMSYDSMNLGRGHSGLACCQHIMSELVMLFLKIAHIRVEICSMASSL